MPHGFWGKRVLREMNSDQHCHMPEWALDKAELPLDAKVLDVGCGGGSNMKRMLQRFPQGTVTGIDPSSLALDYAYRLNYEDMMNRCIVIESTVERMTLCKDVFDLVTAFDTVYYWSSMETALSRIHRVLKPGATLLIANELDGDYPEHEILESKTSRALHVYKADELVRDLNDTGFTGIEVLRDTVNHYLCVMCKK